MTKPAVPGQSYLQALLDSFRGELCNYGGDLPAEPYEATNWTALVETTTVLPELALAGHRLVEKRLGYRPPLSMLRSEEAFLRALIQHHHSGHLPDEEFVRQADQCIRGVRAADMQVSTHVVNPATVQKRYETYLPAYRDQARNRLAQHLGYLPDLAHSLLVELWLRQVMARDQYALPPAKTPLDCKAVMLVQYRELYAEGGQAAADALPLPADTSVLD